MEFRQSVASRTRSRRALYPVSTSDTKRKRRTRTGATAGLGVRHSRKQKSPVIVDLDEEEDEKVGTFAAVNSVAGRTRSKRRGGAIPMSRPSDASKEPIFVDSDGSECLSSPSSSCLGDNGGDYYSTCAFAKNGDDGDHDYSDDAAKNDGNGDSRYKDDANDGSGPVEESGSCSSGMKKGDNETGSLGGADSKSSGIAQQTRSHLNGVHLVPGDNETGNLGGVYSKNCGIAHRTRSQLNRVLQKEKLGTSTDPIDLDLDVDCPKSAPAVAKSNDFLQDDNSSEGNEDNNGDSDSDDNDDENDNAGSSSSDEEYVVSEEGGDHVMDDAVDSDDDNGSSHEGRLVSKDGGSNAEYDDSDSSSGEDYAPDKDGGDGNGSSHEERLVSKDGGSNAEYDGSASSSDGDYAPGKDGGDDNGSSHEERFVSEDGGGSAEYDDNDSSSDEDYAPGKDGGDRFMHDADGRGGNVDGNRKREKVQFGEFTMRKRAHLLKDNNFFKLLLDTIWSKDEKLPAELSERDESPTKNVEKPESLKRFPLKFSWDDDKVPEVEEKTEEEEFIDKLWTEFDFAMKSRDLGCFSPLEVDNDGRNALEFERSRFKFCHKDKHQFILDEEIGIKCILCPFVKLGIRDILPPMVNSWEKSTRHSSAMDGDPLFHKLHCQDINGDSQCAVPSEGTVWDIIPGVKETMYPHQQEGFEFIWKNLAGSIKLEQLKESTHPDQLGGCVISHAPGTGKTRLAIVFIQTFMEVFPQCRPIILAPSSMLLTWEKEFRKWKVDIPIHILSKRGFSGKEDKAALRLGQNKCKNWVRLVKIFSWNKGQGILGLTYNLFEKLVGKSIKHDKGMEVGKILTEKTGLLVLDEGHTPRNERSLIWKALEKVKTNRRIILSGTPFQNNFVELYNTLCLVRPQFANNCTAKNGYIYQRNSEKPSDNAWKVLLERRYGRGKWVSLTSSIGKSFDANLEKLRSLMDPFVHVYKGTILKNLPGLRDCVLVLHPRPPQKRILEIVNNLNFGNNFHREHCTSLISVHPSLLLACNISDEDGIMIEKDQLKKLRLNPNEGVKTRFVMELIRLCDAVNEKVLIFSQYINPLKLLEDQLKHLFDWTEGKEVLQMNGEITDVNRRQSCIDFFNDPKSEARVLLASTRAFGEGISLIGASRVVFLDVVWNPSVERQAISRAYRIGQEKVVYSYHLLTSGTREGDKYYRQAEKDRLSELLFSSTVGDTYKQQDSSKIFKDRMLEEMVGHEKLKTMFEKILHQPRKSSILDHLGQAAFEINVE